MVKTSFDWSLTAAKISSYFISIVLFVLLILCVCGDWLLIGLYLWSIYPIVQLLRNFYDKWWQIALYGVLWPFWLMQNVFFVVSWYYFD